MSKINKVLLAIDGIIFIIFIGIILISKYQEKIEAIKVNNSENTQKVYTVGLSLFNQNQEYFMRIEEGVREKAKELGIDIIVHDQKSSTVEMTTGVSALLEKDIDALLISPYNPEAMGNIVIQAKEKGIPIIVIDIGAGQSDVDATILSDSFGGGVLAGEYALELIDEHNLKSKNVAIIEAKESSTNARKRGDGFANVMKDYGYEVIATLDGNSDRETAYHEAKALVANYDDNLAVIFVENDDMALGVAKAVEEAGKKGKIMIIGFNADPSAIEAIKDGSMQGTIAQQPNEMGKLGLELAHTLLQGGQITFDDSQAKQIYMEVYLIDENAEQSENLFDKSN